jgi:hypothetical protein
MTLEDRIEILETIIKIEYPGFYEEVKSEIKTKRDKEDFLEEAISEEKEVFQGTTHKFDLVKGLIKGG